MTSARWDPNPSLAAARYRYGWPSGESGPAEWLGLVEYMEATGAFQPPWRAVSGLNDGREVQTMHMTLREAMGAVVDRERASVDADNAPDAPEDDAFAGRILPRKEAARALV